MTRQSFLELDSTYRNRNLDAKVSDFTVTLSQSGIKNQANSIDPVSNAYPVNVFSFAGLFNQTLTLESFDTASNIVNTSSTTTLILSSSTSLGTQSGTFTGCVLVSKISSVDDEYRRISDWKYLLSKSGKFYYKVSVESVFSVPQTSGATITTSQPKKGSTFIIYNPSDFSDPTRPYLFLTSSLAIPNYYNKYILYNQTRRNYASILSYDMETHLALLGDITGKGWVLTDTFVVRGEAPAQVLAVNTGTTTSVSTATYLPSSSSFYINSFIRITTGTDANQIRRITGTNEVFASPTVTPVPPNTLYVSPPFSSAVSVGDTFEILQFSYDNYSPFVYTGTLSSNSQPVAHEISLNSLTLPNVFLTNGGRIAYYPYVYVVLENVSTTSGNPKNLIYSNNPNNYKAVFRAPITDLNHPNNSPFVKLTGNGMKQTMVFKQNDDVHVSILLPNGDLFDPITTDNPQGQEPNPLIQTSLVFSMERVQ